MFRRFEFTSKVIEIQKKITSLKTSERNEKETPRNCFANMILEIYYI